MAPVDLRKIPRAPAVALVLTLAFTVMAAAVAGIIGRSHQQGAFERDAEVTRLQIAARLEASVNLLRGAAAIFAASEEVGRGEFTTFVERLRISEFFPGIQGVGFAQRVRPGEAAAVEAKARVEGFSDFRIWPQHGGEAFPIVFIEPLDRRNRAALGYDMHSEPVRRAAMEAARDLAMPAVSDRVTLVQEIDGDKQPGFLIYVPVYEGGAIPATVEQRRRALLGYVYSPFRSHDLFRAALRGLDFPLLGLEIYDDQGVTRERMLFAEGAQDPARFRFVKDLPLEVAGYRWTLRFRGTADVGLAAPTVIVPITAGAGTLVSFVILLILRRLAADIAARRAAEAELRAANQAKDNFLAALSHELRTPLTPVLAIVSTLEHDENLPAETRGELGMARRNVELEARLIDDLLDLTRIARGKLLLHLRPTDVRSLVWHCADSVVELQEKAIDFAIEWEAAEVFVSGDRSRLTQVFWNLLKNAAKFTPVGGRVRLRAFNEPAGSAGRPWLSVECEDNGVGIAPEVLPRLFQAFEQGGAAVTQRFGGLGLGLTVSKAIVDLHGGTISAASAGPGRGARFTVRLPTVSAPAGSSAPATQLPRAAAAGKLHLLLVEDHADTAEILTRRLSRIGHRVTHAGTLQSALDTVAAAQSSGNGDTFDLVISDLGLPDGSGLDLMRKLSAEHGLRGIAISGYGMESDIQHSAEAGFERHLTKPIDFDHLRRAIDDLRAAPATAVSAPRGAGAHTTD
jgi:signal transduction histidine kinase/ActR/RegA family two-component response regulator